MKVLVINGSPKGGDSVTLQTIRYLEHFFKETEFEILDAGKRIHRYEKDFSEARAAVEKADLIVFAYPVYTFLVPAQLHRFIELMKEAGMDLSGKYATQVSTSMHFYDVTAHRFIQDNCEDLGLSYIRGFSGGMDDLLQESGQKQVLAFFRHVLWHMQPQKSEKPADSSRRVAIVADFDASDENSRLAAMIGAFTEMIPYRCDVVNIRTFPFAGGCLGCMNCVNTGECVYKDGFDRFLRENIQSADAIIYAYTVQDHSMGYRFKLYDDRQFCNGHRTVTMGKPVGYLVDGDLSEEENLRMLMEARAQVGGNYLAGIVSGAEEIENQLHRFADELAYCVEHQYSEPKNFYGVGGLKIFRDLIYQMRGFMRADHRFYKEHGFYDFPQKKKGTILGMYLVGAMMNNKKLRKKLGGRMTEGMLMPYKKVMEKLEK